MDLLHLDHKSGYGLTERKIGWEVTFALRRTLEEKKRRTAEGRGFERVSPSHLVSCLGICVGSVPVLLGIAMPKRERV